MEKILASVSEVKAKLGTLTYSQLQEVRISSELCDRSHFEVSLKRLYDAAGMKFPKEISVICADPSFDTRLAFMKQVVAVLEA